MKPSKPRYPRKDMMSAIRKDEAGDFFSKEGNLENESFANYSEYNKTLRAWLVAYGIGGPVLLLTNEKISTKFSSAPNKKFIVYLFLAGVACQVLLAFLNKWCAWYVYAGEAERSYRHTRTYKAWNWINSKPQIDFVLDSTSVILFSWSTWLAASIFL